MTRSKFTLVALAAVAAVTLAASCVPGPGPATTTTTTSTTTSTTTTSTTVATGPQLVVDPVPEGLPRTSPTSVTVTGTGFEPGSGVQLQQCAYRPGLGYCQGQVNLIIPPDGTIAASAMTLNYLMSASDPFVECNTGPDANTTCDIRAVYSSGPFAGTVAAIRPVTFAETDPFAPGCYDYVATTTQADLRYDGPIDTLDNAVFIGSTDGTCSGSEFSTRTIIQAADQAAANVKCQALEGNNAIYQLNQAGLSDYEAAPTDVWFC